MLKEIKHEVYNGTVLGVVKIYDMRNKRTRKPDTRGYTQMTKRVTNIFVSEVYKPGNFVRLTGECQNPYDKLETITVQTGWVIINDNKLQVDDLSDLEWEQQYPKVTITEFVPDEDYDTEPIDE